MPRATLFWYALLLHTTLGNLSIHQSTLSSEKFERFQQALEDLRSGDTSNLLKLLSVQELHRQEFLKAASTPRAWPPFRPEVVWWGGIWSAWSQGTGLK